MCCWFSLCTSKSFFFARAYLISDTLLSSATLLAALIHYRNRSYGLFLILLIPRERAVKFGAFQAANRANLNRDV